MIVIQGCLHNPDKPELNGFKKIIPPDEIKSLRTRMTRVTRILADFYFLLYPRQSAQSVPSAFKKGRRNF